jgi:hypothetical protein
MNGCVGRCRPKASFLCAGLRREIVSERSAVMSVGVMYLNGLPVFQ